MSLVGVVQRNRALFMSISRFAFVSCVLLTVHAEVLALSLGPVQGRAWLGNRLAVQVPVYLHPDEINQDLCVQVLSITFSFGIYF